MADMKTICLSLSVAFAALLAVRGAEPVRRLILADESRARLHYYDSSDPAKCFFVPAEKDVWDLQRIGKPEPGRIGRFRFVCKRGFQVVDLDTRKVVDVFRHNALTGVSAVSDLPGGGFIACVNPGGRMKNKAVLIRKFSADRRLVATYTFAGIYYARTMTLLPDGEIIIAHMTGFTRGRLPKADRDLPGEVIQHARMPRSRNLFHVIPRRDGTGYLAGAGYAAELLHYDRKGQVTASWTVPAEPDSKGYFYGQIQEMANRHVYVANWSGHGKNDSYKGWQVAEFDENGKVVWKLRNPDLYGSTSGMLVLEAPGKDKPKPPAK